MNIDPSLLIRAAQAAAGHQQHPPGTLYVVATPIGNLADLSLRAVHVLALADTVACEDTRVTGHLLHHLGLDKPMLALHQHNEHEAAATVVQRLAQGQRVAQVSDAGTPAVSDPGAVLVAAARAAGHRVMPIPGASSALAALSAAGDVRAEGFRVSGFLPAKGTARAEALQRLAASPDCQVLFEAPHRIEALAQTLAKAAPQRAVTVARELTKQFEALHTLPAAELPAWLAADRQRVRGEFVLVIHAAEATAHLEDEGGLPPQAERTLQRLMQELPLKQAVDITCDLCGVPRKPVYARALALRQPRSDDGAESDEVDNAGDNAGDNVGDRMASDDSPGHPG